MNSTESNPVKWTAAVDSELYAQLKELSKETQVPVSQLMNEALKNLLIKYDIIDENTDTL
ncbi:MAG: ribbon-helix-helix domain-containing protein [Clostridiales bacterium]|nr:ribbon-helix-helix domain-containing protein [Clostridiales bacterium]